MQFTKAVMAAIAVVVSALATPSQATPLTGDIITMQHTGVVARNLRVHAALDDLTTLYTGWDFDAGPNGDLFQISVSRGGPGFAVGAGSPFVIELGSLDFQGGEVLVGFADLFSVFTDISFEITDHSIRLTMTDGPVAPGVVFSGRFVTRPFGVTVPEPASLALFAVALAGLGTISRRRRSQS